MNKFKIARRFLGFNLLAGAFWCGVCMLPKPGWVLSGYSDFQPQSKDMYTRLSGDSQLVIGVNVVVSMY